MRRIVVVAALALGTLACGGGAAPAAGAWRGATVVPDSPTCATYGLGTHAFRVTEPGLGGTWVMDEAGNDVTLASTDGVLFTWTSPDVPIEAIIIKGGPGATIYQYPPNGSGWEYGWAGLVAHDAAWNVYPPDYVEFCYDFSPPAALEVTVTAVPSFTERFLWSVAKTSDTAALTLMPGQTYLATYTVVASVASVTPSGFAAGGDVTIHNPAGVAATITAVTAALGGGGAAPVACPAALPVDLAPGATLVCTWSLALAAPAADTLTATVATTGPVGAGSATAAFDFAAVAPARTDACVAVTDDHAGALGTVCAADAPRTFTYPVWVGGVEVCGSSTVDNVAVATALDTGAEVSATWTIDVTVPCDGGCTLTPGYWKTHASTGAAPYDDTWALVGETSPFFLSGTTWLDQFLVSPAGNAYYQLSHAYAAAELNRLNGAAVDAVAAQLDQARVLLETYTPAQVRAMKRSPVRDQFVALAGALGAYDLGAIGPGHCSE